MKKADIWLLKITQLKYFNAILHMESKFVQIWSNHNYYCYYTLYYTLVGSIYLPSLIPGLPRILWNETKNLSSLSLSQANIIKPCHLCTSKLLIHKKVNFTLIKGERCFLLLFFCHLTSQRQNKTKTSSNQAASSYISRCQEIFIFQNNSLSPMINV